MFWASATGLDHCLELFKWYWYNVDGLWPLPVCNRFLYLEFYRLVKYLTTQDTQVQLLKSIVPHVCYFVLSRLQNYHQHWLSNHLWDSAIDLHLLCNINDKFNVPNHKKISSDDSISISVITDISIPLSKYDTSKIKLYRMVLFHW